MPTIAPGEREIPVGTTAEWAAALAAWDDRRTTASALAAAERFAALAAAEGSVDAAAWCARTRYFVGDYQPSSRERSRWFEEGWRLGRAGVEKDAGHIGASFWTACCLAGYVDTLSVIWAPKYAPEIVRCLKRVHDADREYYWGGLARFVTQAYVKQPFLTDKFLRLAVPDLAPETILEGLQRAVAEGPPFVFNVQCLGELAFHVHKDRATPRAMLERLDTLDLDAVPNLAPENHLHLARARKRLGALA